MAYADTIMYVETPGQPRTLRAHKIIDLLGQADGTTIVLYNRSKVEGMETEEKITVIAPVEELYKRWQSHLRSWED